MSIQYSGNAAIYSFTTGSSTPSIDFETAMVSNLILAGWTDAPVAASGVLTFTLQPAATSTFTLDSSTAAQTYEFVSSSPTGNQILISAVNLAGTLQNVLNALNSGPGSGTTYGSGLVPPPNMTAAVTATTLTVTYKTTGSSGNGAATSVSGTINATWGASTLLGGEHFLISQTTPQGLNCAYAISTAAGGFYSGGTTNVNSWASTLDKSRSGALANAHMTGGGGAPTATSYKLIADKYQFFCLIPGSQNNAILGNGMAMGVPFITSNLVAPTISAATNANPIVCTITNHGFSNSDSVLIVNALGNTAANGIWTITVIDANTFSIPTTGNGTYTANSALCTDLTLSNSIGEAIWSTAADVGGLDNLRNKAYEATIAFTTVNTNVVTADASSARIQIVTPGSIDNAINTTIQWYDNTFLMNEPFIMWGISSGATSKIIGQIWDAAMVRVALTIDQTASFDNPAHTFWAIGSASNNSILLATTP